MIGALFDGPVDPDADQAREWLVRELADPRYQAARPSWFDQLSAGFLSWLQDLLSGATGAPSGIVLLVVVLVLAGVIVGAYFVFGAPRLNRRARGAGALFGEDDGRDAAAMRSAAELAARSGEFSLAIQEMFRSIARGLDERAVLSSTPGTTATGFAGQASGYFPGLGDALQASAADFDAVRYLGRDGTEPAYRRVADLERTVRAARPAFDAVPA